METACLEEKLTQRYVSTQIGRDLAGTDLRFGFVGANLRFGLRILESRDLRICMFNDLLGIFN